MQLSKKKYSLCTLAQLKNLLNVNMFQQILNGWSNADEDKIDNQSYNDRRIQKNPFS